MSIKADYDRKWTTFSEEQAKRMRDREEWDRKAEEEYQARMKVLRQQKEAVKEEVRKRERDAVEYAAMVNKMLQELYEQNPEWEARKREVRRVSTSCVSLSQLILTFSMVPVSDKPSELAPNHKFFRSLCRLDRETVKTLSNCYLSLSFRFII